MMMSSSIEESNEESKEVSKDEELSCPQLQSKKEPKGKKNNVIKKIFLFMLIP